MYKFIYILVLFYIRTKLSIIVEFATKMIKYQGQTFKKVPKLLQQSLFTHGQFYIDDLRFYVLEYNGQMQTVQTIFS